MSLHGIEIPTTVFPDYWQKKANQAEISFPFPIVLVVDVCGNRDLDLNSPRTEILASDKWQSFEEELAAILCKRIRTSVSAEYWEKLRTILARSKNENFLRGLAQI
jgi:molecular chaperone HtpG